MGFQSEQLAMVWITLIEVEATQRNEDFPPGGKAFVTACADSTSAADAEKKLAKALNNIRFRVVVFEDTRPWLGPTGEREAPGIAEMVEEAELTNAPQFGTFHTWDNQG